MAGSSGAGALSFSHTLRKGWVTGSSGHSMDESTKVSENPTRDTIVESHPSKTKGGAPGHPPFKLVVGLVRMKWEAVCTHSYSRECSVL